MLAVLMIFAAMSASTGVRLKMKTSKEIRLLLVRHGLSCANILSEYGGAWKLVEHKNYPDPLLSDCGVSQSIAAAEILAKENVDYVASSFMLRAIETAWLQFKKPVHVIPHIGEEAHGVKGQAVKFAKAAGVIEDADNTPLPADEQRDILRKHYPEEDIVDFAWANSSNPSSWQHFEEFLQTTLLPSIIPPEHTGVFTIGIASHSLFLQASLGKSPEPSMLGKFFNKDPPSARESICYEAMPEKNGKRTKPNNNQVLQLFYDYDKKKQHLELNVQKKCTSLGVTDDMPTGVPGAPQVLCEADFQRCVPGWPMDSPELTCKEGPRTVTRVDGTVAPGDCATHHECNSEAKEVRGREVGYKGFPYVKTVEQKWAEAWRAIDKMGDSESGPKIYPPFPDLHKVCQCAAPYSKQTCPK